MEKDQRWEELQQHMEELQEKLDALEDRFKPVKDLSYEIYDKLPRKWPLNVKIINRPHRVVELFESHLFDIKECLKEWMEQHGDCANDDDLVDKETYDRRAELLAFLEEIHRLMAN